MSKAYACSRVGATVSTLISPGQNIEIHYSATHTVIHRDGTMSFFTGDGKLTYKVINVT